MNRGAVLRVVAPIAFLVFVTLAVLFVRQALETTQTPTTAVKVRVAEQPRQRPPKRPVRRRFYVIRSGDTLAAVAERFATTVPRLLTLNPGLEPTALRIGQKIRIA